jgi:hypothetical protein
VASGFPSIGDQGAKTGCHCVSPDQSFSPPTSSLSLPEGINRGGLRVTAIASARHVSYSPVSGSLGIPGGAQPIQESPLCAALLAISARGPATDILMEGLRKLEYRGYDSAGLATVLEGELHCVRAKGKLQNLQDKLTGIDNPARLGIGHTRWATHGKPEEHNAHPHTDTYRRTAVVQNGIIENYRELREELKAKGHEFRSDTDTEVIPHLIAEHLANPAGGARILGAKRSRF